MKLETYPQARGRLFLELVALGWKVKPALKIPQAIPPHANYTIFFKPQAVYLNQHSMWIDIRGMAIADFVNDCEQTYKMRTSAAYGQ